MAQALTAPLSLDDDLHHSQLPCWPFILFSRLRCSFAPGTRFWALCIIIGAVGTRNLL